MFESEKAGNWTQDTWLVQSVRAVALTYDNRTIMHQPSQFSICMLIKLHFTALHCDYHSDSAQLLTCAPLTAIRSHAT